jgi:CubicO group peptidase (beta-lactamase class C family)
MKTARLSSLHRVGRSILSATLAAVAWQAPSLVCSGQPATDVVYQGVATNEFFTRWLVLAPIPVFSGEPRAEDEAAQKQVFAADLLAQDGGEANVKPRDGQTAKVSGTNSVWRVLSAKRGVFDLTRLVGQKDFAVAYAYAEIEMPETRAVLFGLGSDDAIKVWVNGKLVHENWANRPVTTDDDLVELPLQRGANRLLLKIQNGQGLWGFVCRVPNLEALGEQLLTQAMRGEVERIQRLIALGADVNARRRGLTPLQAAQLYGHKDVEELLMARGADASLPLPSVEQFLDARLLEATQGESPGVAILVARDGAIVFKRGYGYANLEHGISITPETKFRIGSVTKQFTAAAILRLQEQGKLSVTDKLSKFIPDFPRADEVTLHHLLTHTSGIHSYTSKADFTQTATVGATPDELLKVIKADPFDFSPGEKWLYNNSGYFLLGILIEKVSGRSYADFLREEFFTPLGMTNTGVHTASAILKHEATGYAYEGGELKKALNWDMSRAGAAGALYSTVEDLFRWNEGLFNGRVLREASLQAAFTPVVTQQDGEAAGKKATGYGYGWSIEEIRGLRVLSHGGGLHGFSSYLMRWPEQRFTVAVLANALPTPPGLEPGALAQDLARLYFWREMKPRERPNAAVKLDRQSLEAFVGRYDYAGAVMTVTREGDRLFGQLTGQPRYEIFPKSEMEFFWKAVEAEVQFVKNARGEVVKAVHKQGGQTLHAPRLPDEAVVKLDTALLDDYVGKYDYGGGKAILTVSREGERLFAQMTGQPKFEIHPRSTNEFFWKVVVAQVTFVKAADGKVTKAIHKQGGQTIEAPKIE